MLVKGYKSPVIREIISGHVIYSIVAIVNSTILCTWEYLRDQLLNVFAIIIMSSQKENYV